MERTDERFGAGAKERLVTPNARITGRLLTAARGLAGISKADFARAAGLPLEVLDRVEQGGSAFVEDALLDEALLAGLTYFGVLIIPEADGFGAGVRLKFTRQDVRQIVRLEGEGGIVGSDDAP